ncbi:hypothetical protein SAMN05216223_11272 [Actinacidiphila yanglinensis]|uniref:Uncharacterized protein n=1 Tax=Actinacidiphila yanglinensis TaxID=310779 RepID=A0A1H6D5W1_9ACTN|nr:hypothetical protein [Actinacidiphila yanglinensis]SEG80651.1 hypothetical protein SAMN05216223_11272 [Actinacidiphila yanglinensis]
MTPGPGAGGREASARGECRVPVSLRVAPVIGVAGPEQLSRTAADTVHVVAESLAWLHPDTHDSSVVCLRLGPTGFPLTGPVHALLWLSDDDAGRLVVAAPAAEVGFGVYVGVSAPTPRHWDAARTMDESGYVPKDDPADLPDERGEVSRLHW